MGDCLGCLLFLVLVAVGAVVGIGALAVEHDRQQTETRQEAIAVRRGQLARAVPRMSSWGTYRTVHPTSGELHLSTARILSTDNSYELAVQRQGERFNVYVQEADDDDPLTDIGYNARVEFSGWNTTVPIEIGVYGQVVFGNRTGLERAAFFRQLVARDSVYFYDNDRRVAFTLNGSASALAMIGAR